MEITALGFKSWKRLEKGREKKKANTVGSLGGIKKKSIQAERSENSGLEIQP